MKNKLYFLIIIVLLPFTIKSLSKKEIDNKEEIKQEENIVKNKEESKIKLKLNNEIVSMDLEDYIIGVVGAEVPASFNMEALKAQAIASRTFTINKLQTNEYMTLSMQAYKSNEELQSFWLDSYDKYYNKIKEAVLSTKNLIITYQGNPIKAYYYSMSNGKTEDSLAVFNEDLPYIESIPSIYDNESINKFVFTKDLSYEEFCSSLKIDCSSINIQNIEKDSSDRVSKITVNDKTFTGIEIRNLLDLRSTDFQINLNDTIKIITKGYGHGVGMSQYGANGMANNNYNYEEILKYYYKDVEITPYNV